MPGQRVDDALSEVLGILDCVAKAGVDSTDSAGEPASHSLAMVPTPAEQDGCVRSSKRQRKDATESGQTEAATPGQARHVKAIPSTSAKTCAPLPCPKPQCAHGRIHAHRRVSPNCADGPRLLDSAAEDLRQRAERIRMVSEGEHLPAPERLGTKTITHELLMLSHDIVLGLPPPKLSGKAQFRLLAWLVADAMTADTPLDRPLAETVGKRLARQADSVRGQLAAVSDKAAQERTDARDAVGLAGLAVDPTNDRLQAELSEKLAAIDVREAKELDLLGREDYVGFRELGPVAPQPDVTPVPAPRVLSSKMTEEQLANMATEEEEAEYDAARAQMAQWRLRGGPLPPEIAQCLGEEGCRIVAPKTENGWTGDEILQISIPHLVRHLLSERVRQQESHEGDLALEREHCESRVASAQEWQETWKDMHGEVLEESDRLRVELAKAEARMEELRDVIGLLKK